MVKVKPDYEDSIHDEIISEGMLQTEYTWIPIETVVEPQRETEKAYYGIVSVYECDEYGRSGLVYDSTESWVPKSMATNPWWILTNVFDETNRVANRRFDDEYNKA